MRCYTSTACHSQHYALEVIDEISQLDAEQFDRIVKFWLERDRIPALAFCGDRFQMAGMGDRRPWESRFWTSMCYKIQLHEFYRCQDKAFNSILASIRTAQPNRKILRMLRKKHAWRGSRPEVADIRKLFYQHPNTTVLTFTRSEASEINNLALQVKYPRRQPLAELRADLESNPDNYHCGSLKDTRQLQPYWMRVYPGMSIFLTKNVRKDIDFVNGMLATVETFDLGTSALTVLTETGFRVLVTHWADPQLGNLTYYPISPGYASTVMKFQGAELDHVTLYLD